MLCSSPALPGLFLTPHFWVQTVPLGGCCSRLPASRCSTLRRAAGRKVVLLGLKWTGFLTIRCSLTGAVILYSGHMGGRAASALLLSALCQPGSYSFNQKKAAAEHFEVLIVFLKLVPTVFKLECGICSAVSYGFFNERSSNEKVSTFPEASYIKNCRANSSGYNVPITR